MRDSVLQLENYFFTELLVECKPDADPSNIKVLDCLSSDDFDFTLQSIGVEESDDEFKHCVLLAVKIKEGSDLAHLYSISLEAQAFVGYDMSNPATEQLLENKLEAIRLLTSSTASVLFGAMRDRVFSMTSSMPWGGLMLPLVTFMRLKQTEADETTQGLSEE